MTIFHEPELVRVTSAVPNVSDKAISAAATVVPSAL